MSALSDYIQELKRQAELLELAEHRDECAIHALDAHLHTTRPGRQWTRQDRNRWDYKCDSMLAVDLAERGIGAWETVWELEPRGRCDTRVERLMRRLPKIQPMHAKALAESQQQGTYSTIAPLVVEVTESHRQLLEFWTDYPDCPEGQHDRQETEQRHVAAIKALEIYLPGELSTNTNIKAHDPKPRKTPKKRGRKEDHDRDEAMRQMSITRYSQTEIGERFGGITAGAVSKAITRAEKRLNQLPAE